MCARPCLSALDTNSFDSQPPYEIGTVVIITSILQTKNQAEAGPGAGASAPGVRVWSVALGRVPGGRLRSVRGDLQGGRGVVALERFAPKVKNLPWVPEETPPTLTSVSFMNLFRACFPSFPRSSVDPETFRVLKNRR